MKFFNQLIPTERVKVILAVTEVPVDKSVALELAGVDLLTVDNQQIVEIEWAFSGSRIKGDRQLYKMGAEQGQRTIQKLSINTGIVHERIIDVLWPRLCGEVDAYASRSGERKG